jgi:hypothetical protein
MGNETTGVSTAHFGLDLPSGIVDILVAWRSVESCPIVPVILITGRRVGCCMSLLSSTTAATRQRIRGTRLLPRLQYLCSGARFGRDSAQEVF